MKVRRDSILEEQQVVGKAAHDAAVSGNPVLLGVEAKDFDGSALPNDVNAEGDVVRPAGSLYGVQYVMCVSEDGSAVGTVTANLSATDNAVLDAIQAAVEIMDDWDETNRAAVNLIASQAGITGGAGAVAANTPRVTLASDDPAVVALQLIDNTVSGTELQVDVVAALPTGSNTIGDVTISGAALTALQLIDDAVYTDDADWTDGSSKHVLVGGLYQSSPQTITDGDVGPFQVDADGALHISDGGNSITIDGTVTANLSATDNTVLDNIQTAVEIIDNVVSGSEAQCDIVDGPVYIEATTSATGLDTLFDSDGDNTAQQCKASAGNLYGIEVSNPNSADAFLQLFDLATGSVTVGTTTPKLSFFVPAGDGTKDGAMDKSFTVPIAFATAITYACTTTATGSGDPTTGLIVNLLFK